MAARIGLWSRGWCQSELKRFNEACFSGECEDGKKSRDPSLRSRRQGLGCVVKADKSLCGIVIIRVAAGLITGPIARVVVEQVIQVFVVERIRVDRVRIVSHGPERKRSHRVSLEGVEIHVLLIAICDKEVVASPAPGQNG